MTKTKDSKLTRQSTARGNSSHGGHIICEITDEDGPQPMRNGKPTQRVSNAADQFRTEHHGEYEARGRQCDERIGQVHRHNAAYPKLVDELDKRRFCSKVTAVGAKRNNNIAQSKHTNRCKSCRVCGKKLLRLQNSNVKLTCLEQRKKARTQRNRISKTNKRSKRARPPKHFRRLSKINTNKVYQMSNYQLRKHKKSENRISNLERSETTIDKKIEGTFGADNKKPLLLKSSSRLSSEADISNDSGKISVNPDTSNPSINTYNSYTTIDQEPMVHSKLYYVTLTR